MKIEIEESALDSLKAMVQQLQDERDACLYALKIVIDSVECCDDNIATWANCFDTARAAIAACIEKKQVLV